MAFKNLVFLVAVAVFLQSAVADPVRIRRWGKGATHDPEENEVVKNNGRDIMETNNVNEPSSDADPEIAEVDAEMVSIPEFNETERIPFVHDFSSNKTAIMDPYNQRCFVMDLDYDRYARYTTLFDLIRKVSSCYYDIDLQVVRQNMRVVLPQIEDTEGLGPLIQMKCQDFHIYMLARVEVGARTADRLSERRCTVSSNAIGFVRDGVFLSP